MPQNTAADVADSAAKRRAFTCIALSAALFMSQGASLESTDLTLLPAVNSEAFYLWIAALALALILASLHLHGAKVRGMLNDETAFNHRLRALGTGFWSAILCSLLLSVISEQISGRESSRLTVTVAVSAALLRFGWLEWKSLK